MSLGHFDVWHAGVVVPDVELSMKAIGMNLGLEWAPLQERAQTVRTGAGEVVTENIRFTYSIQGTPHLELIQSREQRLWRPAGGGALHHLGGFVESVPDALARFVVDGYEVEFGGGVREQPTGFVYLIAAHGVRIELVDGSRRDDFAAWFSGSPLAPASA